MMDSQKRAPLVLVTADSRGRLGPQSLLMAWHDGKQLGCVPATRLDDLTEAAASIGIDLADASMQLLRIHGRIAVHPGTGYRAFRLRSATVARVTV